NAVTSKLFAQTIQNAVIKTTNARDRGIKHGNLSVNRESKMTSALLEIGFLDSLTDARNLKKEYYKKKFEKDVEEVFINNKNNKKNIKKHHIKTKLQKVLQTVSIIITNNKTLNLVRLRVFIILKVASILLKIVFW